MQPVFYGPVAAQDAGELFGADLVVTQVGDRIHGFGVAFLSGQSFPAAGDLDGEAGVRESDTGGDFGEFHGPGLDPAVALVVGDVDSGDVFPRQRFQFAVQAGLVALHGQYVVRAAAVQVLGVAVLGMQRVGGDDRTGDVQTVEQRGESRYFIGLSIHDRLGEHRAVGDVERGKQMHRAGVTEAGTAGGLAVQGDHPPRLPGLATGQPDTA